MIISKRKYEERIREAVEKEMHNHVMREEQREIRREVYGELDRIRMHMSTLEARIEKMECAERCNVSAPSKDVC